MKRITIEKLEQVGPKLKDLRISKKCRMVPLSKASGISPSTISLIEHGKQYPRLDTLMRYSQALGVDEILIKIPKEETL